MLRLPAIATGAVLLLMLLYWLAGSIGADRKSRALSEPPAARGNYRITLDFAPERFHQVLLQDRGRLVEVRGNTVYMQDVAPAALRDIAREYWVESIASWNPP